MISFPSRCGAFALVLAAGCLSSANAQTSPVDEVAHTDSKGRHLAPRDTFYMLSYTSERTDKGVEGFPPGTEVHLVSVNREAHTLKVSDGHAEVEVSPDRLTNDMDIAALVREKDEAKQARVLAYQQAEAKAYQDYLKEVADYTAKDLEKREQAIKDSQPRPEAATVSQSAQPVDAAVNNNNNGYYGEGGFGYGSPYAYLAESRLSRSNATGGNKGTLSSSQTTTQAGGRQGGGSTGTVSTGGGGKKP